MSFDSPPPYGSSETQPLLQNGITSNGGHVQERGNITNKSKGSNVIGTFFNFAKASIGSGSFGLPFAILSAGVIPGSVGMIILGAVSLYTMQLMLECKRYITQSLTPEEEKKFTYTDLGQCALGSFGKWSVNLSVLACNLGVCAGYMIFIASNFQWSFICFAYHHDTGTGFCFTSYLIYAMILPILVLLTYLPSFKWLAYAAYFGAIFLIIAVITVIVYGIENVFYATEETIRLVPATWEGMAQWFGLTAFLFCVHSMVIPLESSMKKPKYMTYVLYAAAAVVLGINLPFALYGYFLFGSKTKGYIFENMPGGLFNDLVRIFLSLELTLTFPIVFKPASDVMEEIIQNVLIFIARKYRIYKISELYARKELKWKVAHTVMICSGRTVLVLVSWGIAIAIPRFELCLAFVGSLATSILAFVLPPLFHIALKWKITTVIRRVIHVALLQIGIVATVLATGINLYEAITNSDNGSSCTSIQQACVLNSTSNDTNETITFTYM